MKQNNDFEIIANNGKVYKDLRAYHIALGHAVRQALLDFCEEIEKYLQNKVMDFYNEYTPESYERTYQLMEKMNIGELIKMNVKGNFQGKYTFEYELFDWSVLDSVDNGIGEYGSYMSFDKSDSRGDIEGYLQSGIYGHEPFDFYKEIDTYVNKHLDNRIQQVLNRF